MIKMTSAEFLAEIDDIIVGLKEQIKVLMKIRKKIDLTESIEETEWGDVKGDEFDEETYMTRIKGRGRLV